MTDDPVTTLDADDPPEDEPYIGQEVEVCGGIALIPSEDEPEPSVSPDPEPRPEEVPHG